ncbi:MAG: Fic family protein, partial [Bacteroidota bacterium]|nr:Fic family protein [Bacteroidota bacterium]
SVASSEIENIHTTVESVLQQALFPAAEQRSADKEVLRYSEAIRWGAAQLPQLPLASRIIVGIQQLLLGAAEARYRATPNQIVNSSTGQAIYTPPPAARIPELISDWEHYINTTDAAADPLLRCVVGHYQFEAIHPFGDGNGRTGRILMVLQLVQDELLTMPILFISGYINRYRQDYYRLLLAVTTHGEWEAFILFMLRGFEEQARETKQTLLRVMEQLGEFRQRVRALPKRVPGELADHLFAFPVTTPVQAARELGMTYKTTSRYLTELAAAGLLENKQVSRFQFYLNRPLLELLNRL